VAASINPMALPQKIHLGVVVKDMDKTISHLSSTFGIGPWDINKRQYPVEQVTVGKGSYAIRTAFADLGPVELELIEILEGTTIHAEFLNSKGEGLHHIGFRVPDLEKAVSEAQEQGVGVAQSAFREGSKHAYLDPSDLGGIMFEFVERAAS